MLLTLLVLQTTLKMLAGYVTDSFPPSTCLISYSHNEYLAYILSLSSQTTRDTAAQSEVITGTGDALPPEIGSKRLHTDGNPDLSKGHQRYDKHVRQKGSDQEKGASEGATEDEVVDGVIGGR